tara:strand:- start:14 stop:1249 length:1236 start_codon:yes stop_codon:yes gene_type:complete
MKKLFTILFTITCFLTYAADLYVFPGGASPNYSSIHTAVNAAVDGDRVLVAPSTYIENVTMPAISLTIVPLADGGNYTIAGDFDVTATYDGKKAMIVGAIVQGDFGEANGTSSCSGSQINELNIINCEFYQDFYPQICIVTNLYYSTFHCNGGSMQLMSKEIIGNSFLNTNSSYKTLTCRGITTDWNAAANALYGDDKVLKVYGNHFINTKFEVELTSSTESWFENLHIANNFFEQLTTSPYYSNTNYSLLRFTSNPSYGMMVPSFLIENNTFRRGYNSSENGWAFYNAASYSSMVIRNNVIYSSGFGGKVFYFNGGIATVVNNLFNHSTWPSNVTTAGITSPSNDYFYGSLQGGSVNASDNFFNSSSWSSSDIDDNSGIVTTSYATNNGVDIMECRDIDDTQNIFLLILL